MTERWRCFVAVPLGEDLRSALAGAVSVWRREPPADQLRWTDPDSWHLTLAFLGQIAAEDVGSVTDAIAGVAGAHAPTRVETARLGAFHRPGSVRTLWYGVGDPEGRLSALASSLATALGIEAGTYRPHITLGRSRQRPVDPRGWIEGAALAAPTGHLDVQSLRLMRSHLGGGPARYETLATFDLGGTK